MRPWPRDMPRTLRLKLSHCHSWTAVFLVTLPRWILDFVAAPIESLSAPARCAAPRLSEPEVGHQTGWAQDSGLAGCQRERKPTPQLLTQEPEPGQRRGSQEKQSHVCIGCLWLLFLSFGFYSLFFPLLFKKKKIISSVWEHRYHPEYSFNFWKLSFIFFTFWTSDLCISLNVFNQQRNFIVGCPLFKTKVLTISLVPPFISPCLPWPSLFLLLASLCPCLYILGVSQICPSNYWFHFLLAEKIPLFYHLQGRL